MQRPAKARWSLPSSRAPNEHSLYDWLRVDREQSALSKRSPFFKSPRADSDLINAIQQSVAAASIT